MANLYYGDGLDRTALERGSLVTIDGDEARHAVRVSRLRVGERILVGNGVGTIAEGEVIGADRDRFTVRIESSETVGEPDQRLTLVQALAKGDRDERAVEQATEFGVDAIVPWQAARSVSRWGDAGGDKAEKGVSKWARIAREASKQSLRARVPLVRAPVLTKELCEDAARSGFEVVVLHPRGELALSEWATGQAARSASELMLVVGPEGGLADDELDRLSEAGATIVRLGETVLRTSSAGPAALAVLNVALHRW